MSQSIAIAGASGFVGSSLIARLCDVEGQETKLNSREIIALARTEPKALPSGVIWRQTNLFSNQSTFEGLKGVDTAIYLVHSMMPSSNLFQGDFHDTDLLLADNFARACVANGVRQIIYLGGLMPEGYVSPHLQSRFEVEEVFKSTGIPVTVLRAGMIVGPGGSSFEILKTLVQRLPFMILPEWTKRTTQAIFIDDVVDVISASIGSDTFIGKTIDAVNGERLTYKVLLKTMAKALDKKRFMLPLPIRSTEFSKLWVQIFGNSSSELVSPLIDSLLCDLPQVDPSPEVVNLIRYRTFADMARESLRRDGGRLAKRPRRKIQIEKSVRSIQRLPSIPRQNCNWIAAEYMTWLPRFFSAGISVDRSLDTETVSIHLVFVPKPLLILKYFSQDIGTDRRKFHIVGGLLSKTVNTGWLEFRQVCKRKYTLSAIHDFVPSLPWYIYVLTQAPLHKFVMKSFGKHLSKSQSNSLNP